MTTLTDLFASAGKPTRIKSLRDVARLLYRQFPPSTWAILSGGVIGIAIMLSIVAG
jgi:hypothetical protein